ncbi:MAG: phosphoribosyltransferase family protein [Cryomorphaceae bacterium]
MNTIDRCIQDLGNLFFPFQCMGCKGSLDFDEKYICQFCLEHLPTTQYWAQKENPIDRIFWGKLRIAGATSYLYFSKGGVVQEMLHSLKYKHQLGVGRYLGEQFGSQLSESRFADVDLVVPVPLHADKRKKRGYNQCDPIVVGLASSMRTQYCLTAVERIASNESQTRKGRYDRWLNVKSLFRAVKPEVLEGKHVLLVDDVVTTGATLEACAAAILEVPNVHLSLATIACPAVV